MPDNKSKEEKDEAAKRAAEQERLKKEQEKAKEQLDALLNLSRPKDLKEGVAGGVNNILGGAVGAAGIVVLAPTAGLVAGTKHGGIIGGAFGLTGGAVLGVVGGAAVAVMGAISGVGQVVRGVVAAPNAVIQPRKGKWWDEIDGKWVETNLSEEKENLSKVPDDDEDILGPARKEAEKEEEAHADKVEVVDVFYYEVLEVDPKAEQTKIKKQYYMLARRYHPDKVGKDDKEAAEKFKDIAEAYQVLSDPELRAKYDTEGRDALSADKTSAAASNIDATLLFAFLFGSDKFYDYVGRLGMATSASVGDSPKVGANDARTLQKRRCGRLALLLAQRLDTYVGGDIDGAKALWTSEGEELVKASYGYELLHLIGQVYSLCAVQFLGSLDSGIGMPSISKWAHSHSADWKRSRDTKKAQTQTMFAGLTAMQMQVKYQQATSEAKTEEERQKIDADFKKEMKATMIKIMWTTTVVDITNTLHETSQMVLFDTGVDKDARKTRGEALSALGDVLMGIPKPDGKEGEDDPSRLYEEAAMAAMLETVKRKEEATFGHS